MRTVSLTNLSNEIVYFSVQWDSCSIDSALNSENGDWYVILPDETYEVGWINEERAFYLLGYKSTTLKKYTREELIENDIVDFRAQYSYEQLEAMDFTITYTGD